VLTVPFREWCKDKDGKPVSTRVEAQFLPESLNIEARVLPERRRRGCSARSACSRSSPW
jgi:inner membrane protein involved in colicin E2 resistance